LPVHGSVGFIWLLKDRFRLQVSLTFYLSIKEKIIMSTPGEAAKNDESGEEGKKELSSHEIFLQRLMALGALDENSAPPTSSNVPKKSPKRKSPVRKPPAQKPKPSPKPQPSPSKPANKSPAEVVQQKKPVTSVSVDVGGGSDEAAAAALEAKRAAKKARFEAKMRARLEAKRKAAERRKKEKGNKGSSPVVQKPRPRPKPKQVPEPQKDDSLPGAGPSGTELLLKRLEAMGALDASSAPPPSGSKLKNTPKKPEVSKTSSPKSIPRPPSSSSKPESEAKSSGESKKPKSSIMSSTDLLMQRLAAMGNLDESSAPSISKNPSPTPAPKPVKAEPKPAQQSSSPTSAKDIRERLNNIKKNVPAIDIDENSVETRRARPVSSPRMARIRERLERSRSPNGRSNRSNRTTRGAGQSNQPPKAGRPTSSGGSADRLRERLKQMEGKETTLPSAPGGPTAADHLSKSPEMGQNQFDQAGSLFQDELKTAEQAGGKIKSSNEISIEDLRANMEAAHQVLNMEVLEVKEELSVERKKREELEQVLTNTMQEFEDSMNSSNMLRADDIARIGLQETELKQLREKVRTTDTQLKQLRKTKQDLEANLALLTESEQSLKTNLAATKQELSQSREYLVQLKKHAESKLQNAAKLYSDMQKVAEQKNAEAQMLNSERDNLSQKISHMEKQLSTAQQNVLMMEERSATLQKNFNDLQQNSSTLKQQFFEANTGFQQAQQQNRELLVVNERYRVNITQLSERNRELEAEAGVHRSMQDEMKHFKNENQRLVEANRKLKSRIFDAMENMNGGGGGDGID